MIMSSEIYGIDFALACDFLKEIGYVNFGKPDIHIKQIFKELNLVEVNANDYNTLKAITRISENVSQTAYAVDKVFWLIGSGYFYDHEELGNNGRTGSLKKEFIDFWLKNIS